MTEQQPLNFAHFDTDVRPADDLFRHVNGSWLKTVRIDDDKPGAGAFIDLRDEAEAAVRDIILGLAEGEGGAPGSDARRIADVYASFMDHERVNELGAGPIEPMLANIDAVNSAADLAQLFGQLAGWGARGLFGFDADADPGNPTDVVMFAGQSGIGLPDEEYYREEQYAEIRAEYLKHIEKSLELAGIDGAAEQAKAVFDLETEIASHHWDKVRCRDMRQMYNPQTWAEFTGQVTALQWDEYLAHAGIGESKVATVVNAQPSFFTEIDALLTADKVAAWKSWARFAVISSFSPYLSDDFVDERFRFYGTVLSGTPTNRDRWKRGVALVEGALGEAVGKLYVERHFSPTAKERMDELVANLVEAYRQSISTLSWMTESTREQALDKLSKFTPKIGYPDEWIDYSKLKTSPGDLVGNVLASNRFDTERMLDKVGKPIDPNEWFMTPQTVNAYYHPLRNEIVFPAAILQPPFFNADADDAVNYGGIGAVIGHEIGHGFDDQGSTCDGDGRLRDWWTADDRTAFEERTKSLIGQYNELSPEGADGHTVNGELTIGENIGDLGGLSIAYKAWRIALASKENSDDEPLSPAETDGGYTPAQRLFLSWAAVWQSTMRPEAVKQRLATDPHSPNEFRCNQIVRNVDAFYEAFDVTADDKLWLDEDKRVSIW